MKKIMVILAALVLFGTVTGLAPQAQAGGPMGKLAMLFMELDLSSEQKTQAAAILKTHRGQQREQTRELRDKVKTLVHMSLDHELDEQAIRLEFRKTAAMGEEVFVQKMLLMRQLKEILTPEQLQTLKRYREQLRENRGQQGADALAALDTWIDRHAQQ